MSFETSPNADWCRRLYQRKAAELILYGRALGLSHAEAEDVLHELFLALMRRSAPPEQPAHYCVRAFRNRALNQRRNWWTRFRAELESRRWFERSCDETDAERLAMRCLAELPREQREVIVLKFWHRHTFEEIGSMLGISRHTAAGRYRYGLQKLKLKLENHGHARIELDGRAAGLLDTATSFARA